jgi:hypothetical protein
MYADELLVPWLEALYADLPAIDVFDCHTHVGVSDPSGFSSTAEQLLHALSLVDARAAVFPLKEPAGYGQANLDVARLSAENPDRLVSFARLDPADAPLQRTHDALAAGARGLKLHLSGEDFAVDDERLKPVYALERLTATAEVEDYTHIWWDIRPHPRLGTIEVRVMDVQSSLDLTAGLVALVHGLAGHALEQDPAPVLSDEMLAERSFRAARYGMAATLADREGRMRPVQELARAAVTRAWPFARERGCEEALALVETLIAMGNGAQHQRDAYAAGGMPAVVRRLIDATTPHA